MKQILDQSLDLLGLEAAWLGFLSKLFMHQGYSVTFVDTHNSGRSRPDLILSKGDETYICEIKLYRSERVQLGLIRNAALQLKRWSDEFQAKAAYLIVPQPLHDARYEGFLKSVDTRIEIIGLEQLQQMVQAHPELSAEIVTLTQLLRVGVERPPEGPSVILKADKDSSALTKEGEGTRLADEIQALPMGRVDGADSKFERLCEESLNLLFGNSFAGWRRQSSIDNGFQRVDLIARLQANQSAFWSTLSEDFRTRYVIFEFKNYSDPITQEQIYSTERYLLGAALRSVAVVVARNGISESASRAIHGALREQGKLILCLSGSEFDAMLRGFDGGDDPEEMLIIRRDDILMAIGR